MINTDERHKFLRDEFHGLTLRATLTRANPYAAAARESDRELFRKALRQALEAAAGNYAVPVPDAEHVRRIGKLADQLSREYRAILRAGRFRIGLAQKALNLFLKYLWCASWIPSPPHCPFDARIIAKLPPQVRINWTTIDDLAGYERLVHAARQLAGARSLAEWELHLYDTVSFAAGRTRPLLS